jgi:hypothetical protein
VDCLVDLAWLFAWLLIASVLFLLVLPPLADWMDARDVRHSLLEGTSRTRKAPKDLSLGAWSGIGERRSGLARAATVVAADRAVASGISMPRKPSHRWELRPLARALLGAFPALPSAGY